MTPRDANALAGLRAAREFLWDGAGIRPDRQVSTICRASERAWHLFRIDSKEFGDSWALLGAALGTKTSKSLMEWIAENGGAEWVDKATDRDKQQVRHLWLEQLISDLEARG